MLPLRRALGEGELVAIPDAAGVFLSASGLHEVTVDMGVWDDSEHLHTRSCSLDFSLLINEYV